MSKTIFITGSTDGIGLETAKKFLTMGHRVLLHGRNQDKLDLITNELGSSIKSYRADLSNMTEVKQLADNISKDFNSIDVLINNAGVFKSPNKVNSDGVDLRFAVNTLAPYLLAKKLLSNINPNGRIINLASAAQAPISLELVFSENNLNEMDSYAQSKLALIMWSKTLAEELKPNGPVVISVNPGSLLGSKMVKEGFGIEGKDLNIGVNALVSLSLDEEHKQATGLYFDNDSGAYADPHEDALDNKKVQEVVDAINSHLHL